MPAAAKPCLLPNSWRSPAPILAAPRPFEKVFAPQVGKPARHPGRAARDPQRPGRWPAHASLNYSVVEKNNQLGLLVTAEEKSYAPPIVRPQITVSGSQYNNVLFSVGARITFLNVGSFGS